jgi:hypothetical protein
MFEVECLDEKIVQHGRFISVHVSSFSVQLKKMTCWAQVSNEMVDNTDEAQQTLERWHADCISTWMPVVPGSRIRIALSGANG